MGNKWKYRVVGLLVFAFIVAVFMGGFFYRDVLDVVAVWWIRFMENQANPQWLNG